MHPIPDHLADSELAAFQTVCHLIGIYHHVEPKTEDSSWYLEIEAPEAYAATQWCLTFVQNHLYFDAQGRFLGTLGDENGDWYPRGWQPREPS